MRFKGLLARLRGLTTMPPCDLKSRKLILGGGSSQGVPSNRMLDRTPSSSSRACPREDRGAPRTGERPLSGARWAHDRGRGGGRQNRGRQAPALTFWRDGGSGCPGPDVVHSFLCPALRPAP